MFLTGVSSTTMNVHLLSHLTYFVEAWGPLWTMSCFSFESTNGILRRHFHGSKNMSNQVIILYAIYEICYQCNLYS